MRLLVFSLEWWRWFLESRHAFLIFFFKWPKLIKPFASLFLRMLQNKRFLVIFLFFTFYFFLRPPLASNHCFKKVQLLWSGKPQAGLDKNSFSLNEEMSWSKRNINKFVYKNRAIVGLCLDSTLIWAFNLSGQFLMAHIFGQPGAEKVLDPRFPLPRVMLQPPSNYIKHGLWYKM